MMAQTTRCPRSCSPMPCPSSRKPLFRLLPTHSVEGRCCPICSTIGRVKTSIYSSTMHNTWEPSRHDLTSTVTARCPTTRTETVLSCPLTKEKLTLSQQHKLRITQQRCSPYSVSVSQLTTPSKSYVRKFIFAGTVPTLATYSILPYCTRAVGARILSQN